MNQVILFNDDLTFNVQHNAHSLSGLLAGEVVTIYFHGIRLKNLGELDAGTKFDLEEAVELWLEKNEPEGSVIHIYPI